jgi:hypothetical protein
VLGIIPKIRMRLAGYVARMEENRGACNILVGIPEVKRLLGRPTHRRWDVIKADITEIGWKCVGRIHLAKDEDQWKALVNTVTFFFSS